jgi:signal transduction histidine kinase
MKKSIRAKITICLIAIVAGMVALSCIISMIFIKKYYYKGLEDMLLDTYNSCNLLFGQSEDEVDSQVLTNDVVNESGAMIYIVDNLNKKIYTSVNENSAVYNNLSFIADYVGYSRDQGDDRSKIERERIEKTDKYDIQITHDKSSGNSYYDIVGFLDNDFVVIIRKPVSSVDSTIAMSLKFFFIVFSVVAVVGFVMVYIVSNLFAKPVKKLSGVAKEMAKLNLDARADYPGNDEIGELANSMNEMAYQLKSTLTELQQANEKLQMDIDEKVQIDDMRREFLSHVSHELKTPIALVQGYAEGLKDNVIEDEESKQFYCDVILDESYKMNRLVKQLLNLNEMECGNDAVKREVFDINSLIKNVCDSSAIMVEQNHAQVELADNIASECNVYADEFMIEQVFTNYFTNALHYCQDEGKVAVWTVATNYSEPAVIDDKNIIGNLRVFVYDQGPNIPEDELDKVFIKFYKVDKARTREYGGSGIGLSIVAAAMAAHNKNYGVYNVQDGVVFYFDLDMVKD